MDESAIPPVAPAAETPRPLASPNERRSLLGSLSMTARLWAFLVLALAVVAGTAGLAWTLDARLAEGLATQEAFAKARALTFRAERGFLSLRTLESEFLRERDPRTADAVEAEAARLVAILQSLGVIAQAAPIETAVDTLADGVAQHVEAFNRLTVDPQTGDTVTSDVLLARLNASAQRAEDRLAAENLDALAGIMVQIRRFERDFVAGRTETVLDLVRKRHDAFDPLLAEAPLAEHTRTAIAALMDAYIGDLLAFGEARLAEQRHVARFDEIATYVKPALAALTAFRDEADGRIREANAQRAELRQWVFGTLAGAALIVLIVGGLLLRSLGAPARRLAHAARQLADGALDVPVPLTGNDDELGETARALQTLRDRAARAESSLHVSDGEIRARALHVQTTLQNVAGEIETRLGGTAAALRQTARALREIIGAAEETAGETRRRAAEAQAASEHTTAGLRAVVSAATVLYRTLEGVRQHLLGDPNAPDTKAFPDGRIKRAAKDLAALAVKARVGVLDRILAARRMEPADDGEGGLSRIAADTRAIAEQATRTRDLLVGDLEEALEPLRGIVADKGGEGSAARDILRHAEEAVTGTLELSNTVSRITRLAAQGSATARALGELAAAIDRQADDMEAALAALRVRLEP